MVSPSDREHCIGAVEEPILDRVISSPGEDLQEVTGTDGEDKAVAQDTASVEWDVSQEDKRPYLLGQLGSLITWAPQSCRYDPGDPPKFGLALNLLFALVSFVPA